VTGLDDLLKSRDLERPGKVLASLVIVKENTGSTNDDAKALAEDGADHGTVVIAENQSAGRGRLSRSWISPSGRNLLFSIVLNKRINNVHPGLITISTGVAVAEALREKCEIDAKIKWPNDVRVDGKKISGILAEAGGTDKIDYVVLGIGINVNLSENEIADEIKDIASSLSIETGIKWRRSLIFNSVIDHLESELDIILSGDEKTVLDKWTSLSEVGNKKVRAETPEGTFTGKVKGIRDDGALLIEEPDGPAERAILAGDVIIL
jgi:BirA family transcriptional regulator, biotin operon repressor / biotin---[acetyl-CoA-carboxylase] ligase